MDDSEDAMEDSELMEDSEAEEYYSDDEDEDEQCFESEPVLAATSSFQVFDAAGCLELAQAEVRSVSELLCCSCDVSALLLRHFRWDREKLTDGVRKPGLPCQPLPPPPPTPMGEAMHRERGPARWWGGSGAPRHQPPACARAHTARPQPCCCGSLHV